ncbi:MAG: NYN domain-containing protein [candidate division KSB1 bacterium]
MQKTLENYAFIDSQNLNLGVRDQGWVLDFYRFRIFLKEKHGVAKAYMFLGFMQERASLYETLRRYGFDLVFKPVVRTKKNEVKGNVDAELVLQAMIDYPNYKKAVIVTGDGDFYS